MVVKGVQLKHVAFAVVVPQHHLVVGDGAVFSPIRLAPQQSKRGGLVHIRKSSQERRRTNEIPVRVVRIELAIRVPGMLAHHTERGLEHQLNKTPEGRSDAVPESPTDSSDFFESTFRIACDAFEFSLQEQQTSRPVVCLRFNLVMAYEINVSLSSPSITGPCHSSKL